MHAELLRNGVDVAIRCDVQKILVEHGAVAGVQVRDREIKTKAVISNANLLDTVQRLVGTRVFRPVVCRAGRSRPAEQFQHAGVHGTQAG